MIKAVLFDLDGCLIDVNLQKFIPNYLKLLSDTVAHLVPPILDSSRDRQTCICSSFSICARIHLLSTLSSHTSLQHSLEKRRTLRRRVNPSPLATSRQSEACSQAIVRLCRRFPLSQKWQAHHSRTIA